MLSVGPAMRNSRINNISLFDLLSKPISKRKLFVITITPRTKSPFRHYDQS
jgi:hypothetical protein